MSTTYINGLLTALGHVTTATSASDIEIMRGTIKTTDDSKLEVYLKDGSTIVLVDSIKRSEWAQNGIPDKSDSTIAFDNSTRVFTINRTGESFDYYVQGIKYTVATDDLAGANTVTLADTEGMWAIYYDGATLSAINSPTHGQYEDIIMTKCIVALVYYDASNSLGILYEERHGATMSPWTHRYLHEVVGMAYTSGLGLGDFVISDGADNEDAQFSIASGECYDEDNEIELSAINSTTGNIIFYRDGSSWRWTTQTGFKCITFDGTSSTRLAYDNSGTLTEVTNNSFTLLHIFATNSYDGKCISIVGQNEYLTKSDARDGAETELASLMLGGLPTEEMKPIGTIIYQTNNVYANDVKAKIVTTDSGDNYIDWRTTSLSAGVGAQDHGSLGGLGDDDHSQYALLDGRTGGQIIKNVAYEIISVTDAAKTLALTDSNTLQGCNRGTAQTITIPPNADVAIPIGATIRFVQLGVGTVTLAKGIGVDIRSLSDNLDISGQYAGATLTKIATDEWSLVGDLS